MTLVYQQSAFATCSPWTLNLLAHESSTALLLRPLGMSNAAGVALAIIRKLRAFVWIGYGLVVIGVITLGKGERELRIEN